jgi:hypothetical protein
VAEVATSIDDKLGLEEVQRMLEDKISKEEL